MGRRHGVRSVTTVVAAMVMVACHGSPTAPPPPAPATTRPVAAVSPFAVLGPYLAGRSGRVTAALYDDRTGRRWVLDPDAGPQDTASIVKVEIMGAALQEAQAAHAAVPAAQSGLMAAMIEASDNQSATTLLADIGGPSALASFDRRAGMTDTVPSTLAFIPGTTLPGWGLTTTTASDEVTLMSKFAYANDVLSDAARQYGLSLMENVEADQKWGVSAGVPAGSTIALKNGWLPLSSTDWQVNSIGWIDNAGPDYVLAVLTTGNPTESYGIDTIEAISSTVFANLG